MDTASYEKLALFYDILMQGIDYEAWVIYVEELMHHFQEMQIYSRSCMWYRKFDHSLGEAWL